MKDKCKYVNGILEGCVPLQYRLLNKTPWTLSSDTGFNYIKVQHICQSDVFCYCPFCGFLIAKLPNQDYKEHPLKL